MKDKKLRIEDALNATRAAVEEGIVAGGGTTFIDIQPALENIEAEGDVKTGVEIVKRAIEEPVRQIANNAGLEGSVVVEHVKSAGVGVGYNALVGEYMDMIAAGIVDPAKLLVAHYKMLQVSLLWFSQLKQSLLINLKKLILLLWLVLAWAAECLV